MDGLLRKRVHSGTRHGLKRGVMQRQERTGQMRAMKVVIHGVPVAGEKIVAVHIIDVAIAVVVDAVPGDLPRGSTSRAVTRTHFDTGLQGAWRGCARRPSRPVAGFACRRRRTIAQVAAQRDTRADERLCMDRSPKRMRWSRCARAAKPGTVAGARPPTSPLLVQMLPCRSGCR